MKSDTREAGIAEILLDVKNGRTGEYFYKELAKIGKDNPDINMLLLNEHKTAIGEVGGDMLLRNFLDAGFRDDREHPWRP